MLVWLAQEQARANVLLCAKCYGSYIEQRRSRCQHNTVLITMFDTFEDAAAFFPSTPEFRVFASLHFQGGVVSPDLSLSNSGTSRARLRSHLRCLGVVSLSLRMLQDKLFNFRANSANKMKHLLSSKLCPTGLLPLNLTASSTTCCEISLVVKPNDYIDC